MGGNAEEMKILDDSLKRWKGKQGILLMILKDLQDHLGFIPRTFALTIADSLNQPLARVYEALTFYSYFNLEKPGKVKIAVCTGTTCFLNGSREVLMELKRQLRVEEGETTSDGLFHLQTLRCIGCCAIAPAMMIGESVYGSIYPSKVGSILHEWRLILEREAAGE